MTRPKTPTKPKPKHAPPELVTLRVVAGPDRVRLVSGATVTRHAPVRVEAADWAATLKRRPEFARYVTQEE